MKYETPDIFELGDAAELTLGCTGSSCDDCNCAKCGGSTDLIEPSCPT